MTTAEVCEICRTRLAQAEAIDDDLDSHVVVCLVCSPNLSRQGWAIKVTEPRPLADNES